MNKSRLVFWSGISVSLFFVALLLRKLNLSQLMEAIKSLDLKFLAGAIFLTFVSYWLRAVRWRFLLSHERSLPLKSLYPAVIIGYMSNNLFPARIGEFVRSWLLAEREKISFATVFASLIIDRLLDGMTVMFMLLYVLVAIDFPSGMEKAARMLKMTGGGILLVYILVVLFLFALKARPMLAMGTLSVILKPFPAIFSEKAIQFAGSFLGGLRFSTAPSNLFGIIWSSALIWLTATIPVYLILQGFHINLPFVASVFIMVLIVFAIMVPAAPGYIGTYHAACYTGLLAFNISDTQAAGIAIVVHGVSFFPVIIAGLYHMWADGLSLTSLRENASVSRT